MLITGFKLFRLWLSTLLIAAVLAQTAVAAPRPEVREVVDLQQAGETAAARGVPLLLAMTSLHCSYCVRLEEDYLIPMLISGDYTDRVMIRKLQIDAGSAVVDFDGEIRPAEAIARDYAIRVTPTILFLGPDGREVAKRLVGLRIPDFFAGYIDRRIAAANAALDKDEPQGTPGGTKD